MNDASDDENRDDPWLITGDLPCLGCEYNLRGLVGPVVTCPECARENDLRDPEAWKAKQNEDPSHMPVIAATMFVLASYMFATSILPRVGLVMTLLRYTFGACFAVVWFQRCSRWLTACRCRRWGVLVLATHHAGMLLAVLSLWGMMKLLIHALAPLDDATWALALLAPVAATVFWIGRRMVKRGGMRGEFYPNWRAATRMVTEMAGRRSAR